MSPQRRMVKTLRYLLNQFGVEKVQATLDALKASPTETYIRHQESK